MRLENLRTSILRSAAIAFTACSALALPGLSSGARAQALVLVTHRDVAIDNVEHRELQRLFLSQTTSVAGVTLRPVNLSVDFTGAAFGLLTGMSEEEVDMHFVQMDLRGEGRPPAEVADAESLVRLIVRAKTVLGWLPVEDFEALPERLRSFLRVISLDGKRPGESGYAPGD